MLVHTLLWTAIGIGSVFVNPTGRLYMWLARVGWARQLLALGGVRLKVKGISNIDLKQPYVICANHQSLLDIPVLFESLPIPCRFLAKKSLFYIPIFGWSLFLAQFVPVERGKGKRSGKSIEKAARHVRKGPSLVVFPEGTRSHDGKIHKFKTGAFWMAISSGVPILPVSIRGTFECASRHALTVQPHAVEVVFGAPIYTRDMKREDRKKLMGATQEVVLKMFESGEPQCVDPEKEGN